MIQVDQRNCNQVNGDCMRACIASLLEYPLEAVPNFSEIPIPSLAMPTLVNYLWTQGYSLGDNMSEIDGSGVDSCWMASVPSRSFSGCSHAVIINHEGKVVHDPNPNRNWLGEEVVESQKAYYIYNISERDSNSQEDFLHFQKTVDFNGKHPILNALEKVLQLRTEASVDAALIIVREYFK